MGSRRSTSTSLPDLFSSASAPEPSSPSAKPPSSSPAITREPAPVSLPRHVLPTDLPGAMKQLEDGEFDRLLSAVLVEQRRRGGKRPGTDASERKHRVETVAVPLTPGKLNAVLAAFKAGITPSRIARQFGISQSDVRKALASKPKLV
jgi:hypothetical protein